MPPKRTSIQPGQKLELDLTPAERKAILDHLTLLPPEYEVMLKNVHPEQPLLLTLDDLEDFAGYVAAESNHTNNKRLGKTLDAAFEKMTALLDTFIETKPPAKKPTKSRRKRPSTQQALAEWQQQLPEQAAFLATWAAAFLRLTEERGVKHERLEGFVPTDLDRLVLSNLPDVAPKVRKRLDSGKHEFTAAEIAGLLMAIAEQLCDAPANQQLGLLMVAQSLMAAMQAGVSAVGPNAAPQAPPQKPRRSKPATRKPATRKGNTFPLTLTGPQRDTLLAETNVRGTLRKRLAIQATDTRTFNLTRSQLDDLNAIAGYAAVDARFPHKKRLDAVLRQIADVFGVDDQEMLARRAKSKAAKPIPRRPPASGARDNAETGSSTVYQFRITLLDTSPLIWRRIQIEDCTLDTLHDYIQAVMEWTNSHLHHFWIGGKRYGRPSLNVGSVPESHVIDSTQIRLSDILPANGKKTRFGYEYDFGDCWEHGIQFEGIVKRDPTAQYPVCVEGERAGPPDTCGGVPGYEHLLEVLADPNHEEYHEMLDWAGPIDPEYFNAKRATARMTKVRRR